MGGRQGLGRTRKGRWSKTEGEKVGCLTGLTPPRLGQQSRLRCPRRSGTQWRSPPVGGCHHQLTPYLMLPPLQPLSFAPITCPWPHHDGVYAGNHC